MNSAHDLLSTTPPQAAAPLASWYTQGLSDGFGDRLVMFDNTGAGSLELLRFRPQLASFPAFESALRGRVRMLKGLDSRSFPTVHAVEYLDGQDLALVSTHVTGKRLSELCASGRVSHPAFAAWIIRTATDALTELHQVDPLASHGTITPDRIVITPEGRLVIVEHALGAALAQLQPPPSTLWSEYGVMALPGNWAFRQGRRTDLMQVGLVALSTLLGRSVTPAEYPEHLDSLLDEFALSAGARAPALVPGLRTWLRRALQLDGDAFKSAVDAQSAAGEFPDRVPPLSPPSAAPRARSLASFPGAAMKEVTPASLPDPTPSIVTRAPVAVTFEADEPSTGPAMRIAARAREERGPAPAPWPDLVDAGPVDPPSDPVRDPAPSGSATIQYLAIGLGVVAILEGVGLARLLYARGQDQAPQAVQLAIESPNAGDAVMLDGKWIGATPLKLDVSSKAHSIRVVATPRPAAAPAADQQAPAADKNAAALVAISGAAIRQRSGGIRLVSPIELHVLEGERVLGSSKDGPIVASAGTHRFDLINTALGYRSSQTVEIKAGQILPLTIQPPSGQVSVNATPWAQVSIDGNPVGETPLANLSVPLGEHEVTFRHPQLGERRESTIVKAGVLTRVTTTFGR